jgi:hypothetical protein
VLGRWVTDAVIPYDDWIKVGEEEELIPKTIN